VKSVTTPDVTYVSLNEDNSELKALSALDRDKHRARGHRAHFEELAGLETKAFEVARSLNRAIKVAMFGSFTYRGASPARRSLRLLPPRQR